MQYSLAAGETQGYIAYTQNVVKKPNFNIFVINEGFIVILWRPSATAKAIHDTAHDTIHDTKFIAIENLSHRVVWLLDNEMSRNELMAALELKICHP